MSSSKNIYNRVRSIDLSELYPGPVFYATIKIMVHTFK